MPQDGPQIVPRALLAALGRSWAALGPFLAALGSLLVRLGLILEPLGAILGRLGAKLDSLGTTFGHFDLLLFFGAILGAKRVPKGRHFGSQNGAKIY